MKKPFTYIRCNLAAIVAVCLLSVAGSRADDTNWQVRTISFAAGKWDRTEWKEVRQLNQDEPRHFTQNADSLGMTMENYRKTDYHDETDNAILTIDTGLTEGQVEITFKSGEGFNKGATPGIAISPYIVDGVAVKMMGFFVAEWGFAGWYYTPGGDGRPLRYKAVAQQCHASPLNQKHVLRCRYSRKRKAVAIQIDDSDVMVVTFIGHPTLGSFDLDINSTVGIWGCHGECEFYEMKILKEPTLPFDWPVQ